MNIDRTTVWRYLALVCLLTLGFSAPALSQSLQEVSARKCVYGNCENGRGTLELTTPYGKGEYLGNFRKGIFDGHGRLQVPISFLQSAIYVGNWVEGIRSGRGTYWNGKGNLYIGEWKDDKRNGRGAYFFHLPQWRENEHSEFWLSENTENYFGDFVDDFYQGQGTYRWPGGQKYIGGFFANQKHGRGTYFYVTGTRRNQLWNYGDFVE
jgi:hypothetical protein